MAYVEISNNVHLISSEPTADDQELPLDPELLLEESFGDAVSGDAVAAPAPLQRAPAPVHEREHERVHEREREREHEHEREREREHGPAVLKGDELVQALIRPFTVSFWYRILQKRC